MAGPEWTIGCFAKANALCANVRETTLVFLDSVAAGTPGKQQILKTYAKLPLSLEANQ